MKLKMVVVDLEVPARVKRWGLRLGIPACAVFAGGVAWAATLHNWAPGDTLNAADLNGNFSALNADVGTLQGQVATLSGQQATGAYGASAAYAKTNASGTIAHLTFTAPAAGFVHVVATYNQSIRNNAGGVIKPCDMVQQLSQSAQPPMLGSWYEDNYISDGYNTQASSTGYETRSASLTAVFPVKAGANTIYLNGSSTCGDYGWGNIGMSAIFVPNNDPNSSFGVP